MTTNLQKMEEATEALGVAASDHMISELGKVPTHLWRIGGAGQKYEPQEWVVDKIRYNTAMYIRTNPTNEQVQRVQDMVEQDIEPALVVLHVRQDNSSTGVKLSDLQEGKIWSTSRSAIVERAAELCEIYIPKDGQFSCRYCRKATDDKDKFVGTIIARQYPGMRAKFDYCSGRCASHDQMAHEG